MNKDEIRDVVERQLTAYNKRDLIAFVECYDPHVTVRSFPDGKEISEMTGDNFKKRYENLFKKSPNLHCTLLSRTIHGKYVFDKEEVTGFNGFEKKQAMAIYEVDHGKIINVWFVNET